MKHRCGAPTLHGCDVGVTAGGGEVLEELDHVLGARNAEMGHAHVRIRVPDDRGEVAALLLLLRENLAARAGRDRTSPTDRGPTP